MAALPVFRLLTGRFWGFSPRRGDTLHRSRSNLAWRSGPVLPAKSHLDRFRGGGLRPPTLKKTKFTNIIAPCTIFTKFTEFMRVLSLHNFAKFYCFISINGKIINNLLRWWRFQSNFRRPLAAKLWTGLSDPWPCVSATPVITDQYIDTMIFTLYLHDIYRV